MKNRIRREQSSRGCNIERRETRERERERGGMGIFSLFLTQPLPTLHPDGICTKHASPTYKVNGRMFLESRSGTITNVPAILPTVGPFQTSSSPSFSSLLRHSARLYPSRTKTTLNCQPFSTISSLFCLSFHPFLVVARLFDASSFFDLLFIVRDVHGGARSSDGILFYPPKGRWTSNG